MSGDDSDKLLPHSLAPSSEPFYSNIPAAPISSRNYSQAPAPGTSTFGDTGAQDPYSDMGYPTLPENSEPVAPANYAHDPGTTYPAGYSVNEPLAYQAPSVEDLYRAPGNPYSDRSGRSIATPTSFEYTAPNLGTHSPRGAPSYTASPQRTKPKRSGARTRLITMAITLSLIFFGARLFQGVAGWFEETTSLAAVADVDLEEGMCFDDLNYVSGNRLQPVDCAAPHRIEVSANLETEWDTYPGEDEMNETSRDECRAVADDIAAEMSTTRLESRSLYPSEGTWRNGDRMITCFISSVGTSRLVGSAHEGDLRVE